MGTYAVDHAARVTLRAIDALTRPDQPATDLGAWLAGNASSDELMAAVRYVVRAEGEPQVPLLRRIARLGGCPHASGRCTGILAQRGYPGHHAPGLYTEATPTA